VRGSFDGSTYNKAHDRLWSRVWKIWQICSSKVIKSSFELKMKAVFLSLLFLSVVVCNATKFPVQLRDQLGKRQGKSYIFVWCSVSVLMKAIHKFSIPSGQILLQSSVLLRIVDLWWELSSDFKYYFSVVVEQILSLGNYNDMSLNYINFFCALTPIWSHDSHLLYSKILTS